MEISNNGATIILGSSITVKDIDGYWKNLVKSNILSCPRYFMWNNIMSTGNDLVLPHNLNGLVWELRYQLGPSVRKYLGKPSEIFEDKDVDDMLMEIFNEMCRVSGYPLLEDAVQEPGYNEEEYMCMLEFLTNRDNYVNIPKGTQCTIIEDERYRPIVVAKSISALEAPTNILEVASKHNLKVNAAALQWKGITTLLRTVPIETYRIVCAYNRPGSQMCSLYNVRGGKGAITVPTNTPDRITTDELWEIIRSNHDTPYPLLQQILAS